MDALRTSAALGRAAPATLHAAGSALGAGAGVGVRATDELLRPSEVLRAGATYRPRFGDLAPHDVARGRAIVEEALAGLTPVIVVNRFPGWQGRLVPRGDELMGTIHTKFRPSASDRVHAFVRRHWERHQGTHGDGELAGRTVFGSVQFVPRGHKGARGSLAALGEARGGFGIRMYGDHALELTDETLARSTFTGRDSGMGLRPARPAPVERLADVVLERLARSHGFQRDPLTAANDYRVGVFGEASSSVRRGQLLALLHDTPTADAVAAVRRYLMSDALADLDHVIEAQVRGVRARDVAALHREPGVVPAASRFVGGR